MEDFIKLTDGLCFIVDECLVLRVPEYNNIFNEKLPPIPTITSQNIKLSDFSYTGVQHCRKDERRFTHKTIGFFNTDALIERICYRPWNYVEKLAQYKQIMSPDLSCYTDMPIIEQWSNVYLSRFVGAFWQYCGLTVLPTITWSDEASYLFCFSGVEEGSIVAVSTNGTGSFRQQFISGFKEMCRQVKPLHVICYCTPYPEMRGYAEILAVEHEGNWARKLAKKQPIIGQTILPEFDHGLLTAGGI